MRAGGDYGLAERCLRAATRAFRAASQASPSDTKAAGNLGNALLAHGELKQALVDELAGGYSGETDAAAALLRAEAGQLLTAAGEQFRKARCVHDVHGVLCMLVSPRYPGARLTGCNALESKLQPSDAKAFACLRSMRIAIC